MVQYRALGFHIPMRILQTKGLSVLHVQGIGMYPEQFSKLEAVSCLTVQSAHPHSSLRIPRWWTILVIRALYRVARLVSWSRVTLSVLRTGQLTCMEAQYSRCPVAIDLAYLVSNRAVVWAKKASLLLLFLEGINSVHVHEMKIIRLCPRLRLAFNEIIDTQSLLQCAPIARCRDWRV
ncbi:hypothetical protein IQ07DRAFT_274147 [Pyrenochaeta sp. DS3sAY3a]|nr:hypothetical protein IQ07DRAFT_274147 [Pyrenochaeta sp. DS3sAY3a]